MFLTEDGRVNGQSGYERNRLFVNARGRRFHDLSAVSGLDAISDSRGFALWDYDRDGWMDLALVSANHPLLQIFRNEIGALPGQRGRTIAVRFVGGNRTGAASTFASRDGVGAKVIVALDDLTITREYRVGEGFATQNSATMLIGIGARDRAKSVTVRWPSGREQRIEEVAAGTLLVAHENPARFDSAPYSKRIERRTVVPAKRPSFELTSVPAGRVRVYVTMATWCDACKRHLPQLAALRAALSEDDVALIGLPVDGRDKPDTLAAYRATHAPAYEMLMDLTMDHRTQVREVLRAHKAEVLPATIITDAHGTMLRVIRGLPTVSEVKQLLR